MSFGWSKPMRRAYSRATSTVMLWRVTLDDPQGAYRAYIWKSRPVRAAR